MRNTKHFRTVATLALAALPCNAVAHHFMDDALPQTFVQGLFSGLGHPLIGLDHAAFIVAMGFFLALIRRGMWGVAAMIAGSLAGAALHLGGIDLPWGEAGVAVSVMLAAVILLTYRRIGLAWLAGGLALAGMLHGHAYAESIFGAEAAPLGAYLLGFTLTQLSVATAAFFAHRRLIAAREAWGRPVSAGLGVVTGAIGLAFLLAGAAG